MNLKEENIQELKDRFIDLIFCYYYEYAKEFQKEDFYEFLCRVETGEEINEDIENLFKKINEDIENLFKKIYSK